MSDDLVSSVVPVNDAFIEGKNYTLDDILAGVDAVIQQVKDTGEFYYAANTIRSMTSFGRATGIALAKLVYESKELWEKTHDGDSSGYFQYMREFTSVSRVTLERYYDAWGALKKAPRTHRKKLYERPLKDLYFLGSKLEQGYELDAGQWKELANAQNESEFRVAMREATGEEPRKNALTLYISDDGVIEGWDADGKFSIGSLIINSRTSRAVERIIRSSGMIKEQP